MLLGGRTGVGLEPVAVVGGALLERPFLHGVGDDRGDALVESMAAVNGLHERSVDVLREPFGHRLLIEGVGAEQLGGLGVGVGEDARGPVRRRLDGAPTTLARERGHGWKSFLRGERNLPPPVRAPEDTQDDPTDTFPTWHAVAVARRRHARGSLTVLTIALAACGDPSTQTSTEPPIEVTDATTAAVDGSVDSFIDDYVDGSFDRRGVESRRPRPSPTRPTRNRRRRCAVPTDGVADRRPVPAPGRRPHRPAARRCSDPVGVPALDPRRSRSGRASEDRRGRRAEHRDPRARDRGREGHDRPGRRRDRRGSPQRREHS